LGPFLPWGVALAMTLWMGAHCAIQSRKASLRIAGLGMLLVLLTFGWASRTAKSRIEQAVPPGERVISLAVSPAPSNPFCWRVLLATEGPEGTQSAYRARLGVLSLAPEEWKEISFADPTRCYARLQFDPDHQTAPLRPVMAKTLLDRAYSLHWVGEFSGDLAQLAQLAREDCQVAAVLRFVRIPFWIAGPHPVVGDMRYDREQGLGFAEIRVGEEAGCVSPVPDWKTPLGWF
jgi:inner membrane protein